MTEPLDERQKLTIILAARFLEARINNGGSTGDNAYAHQCVSLAKTIVEQVAPLGGGNDHNG